MIPWKLVPRYLRAHPLRSFLTLGSLTVAVFLLCFLYSVVTALNAGVASSSSSRVIVQSAVSLYVNLPLSYQPKIEAVEGVVETCKWQWFGGIYQDRSNFFAQFAVDHETLLTTYPEIEMIEGSDEEFQRLRTGCIIGKNLAQRFPELGVGKTLPLLGAIFPRAGGEAWEFQIAGIYESNSANVDNNTMFFHFDYLEESMDTGTVIADPGVGLFVVRLEEGTKTEDVQRSIDNEFSAGPQRVQTTTEAEFQRQFVTMLGSVPTLMGSIGGAVLFAILLAVINTMMMAARERTQDFGILKALGFQDRAAACLLVAEALLLSVAGGILGVGIAKVTAPIFQQVMGTTVPGYDVTSHTATVALIIAIGVGAIASLVPAWQAARLRPIQAFRAEG